MSCQALLVENGVPWGDSSPSLSTEREGEELRHDKDEG